MNNIPMKKIINRRTFLATSGNFEAAISHLVNGMRQSSMKYRIMSSLYGTFSEVTLETEFDSVAQMQTAWDELNALPVVAEWMPRWYEVTQAGGRNEVLVVEAEN